MLNLYATLATLRALAGDRLRREEGATAVEYGVLVALIIAVLVVVIGTLGTEIQEAFQSVVNELQG